jgi:hypothetical protein
MNKWMGWLDCANKPLGQKIREAADWFKHKYGVTPNICLVSPTDLPENWQPGQEIVPGIQVRPDTYTWKNNLLIGVEVVNEKAAN